MTCQLTEYFEHNNLFASVQFGFRSGMSTVDAIDKLLSSVINGFDDQMSTLAIMCDLSKAFDCVSHDTVLAKLQ